MKCHSFQTTHLLSQSFIILWFALFIPVQCKHVNCIPNLKNCKITCSKIPGYSDDVQIDLSALDNSGGPRFKDIGDSKSRSYTYDWNPCTKFTTGKCNNVNACQDTGTDQYSLGSWLTVYYETDSSQFLMHYTLGTEDRKLTVTLVYEGGEEGRVSKVAENDEKTYSMTLYTKYTPHKGDDDSSISVGTVLCIIFLVIVVLYLGIGITYKHKQGAQGNDKLPNREFWAKMPGLIKDGCIFSARKTKECISNVRERSVKNTAKDAEGYEEIKEES